MSDENEFVEATMGPDVAEFVSAPEPTPEPVTEAEAADVTAAVDAVTLEPGEIIGAPEQREHTIRHEGQAYHHTRQTADGRWIYAPVRPRD